jgi:hypothetical protein
MPRPAPVTSAFAAERNPASGSAAKSLSAAVA